MKKAALVLAFVSALPAFSKNLDGRFGFGVSYLGFSASPAISLKYFHNQLLATNFIVGFNTESSTYQLGAKSLRNVALEENMNVFLGIGAFLLSTVDSGGTNSGFEFDGLFGGEFFLPGLPNLGLHFEVGIGLRAMRTTSFRAVGGGFANGGIHYYF